MSHYWHMDTGGNEGHAGMDGASVTTSQALDVIERELGPFVGAFLLGIPTPLNEARRGGGLDESPPEDLMRRIVNGYEVTRYLVGALGRSTAVAWLFGANSRLDGQAPIQVLGQSDDAGDIDAAVQAARQFALTRHAPPTPVEDLLTDDDFDVLRDATL